MEHLASRLPRGAVSAPVPYHPVPGIGSPVLREDTPSYVIVKNTFISLEDPPEDLAPARRALSSPAPSERSSGQDASNPPGFWLGSLSSSRPGSERGQSSGAATPNQPAPGTPRQRRDNPQWSDSDPEVKNAEPDAANIDLAPYVRSLWEADTGEQESSIHAMNPAWASQGAAGQRSLPRPGISSSSSASGSRRQQESSDTAVPLDENGELTSQGSLLHDSGDCTPCVYMSRGLCLRGADCNFCHFAHASLRCKRSRPPKHVRERLKRREQISGCSSPRDPVA